MRASGPPGAGDPDRYGRTYHPNSSPYTAVYGPRTGPIEPRSRDCVLIGDERDRAAALLRRKTYFGELVPLYEPPATVEQDDPAAHPAAACVAPAAPLSCVAAAPQGATGVI